MQLLHVKFGPLAHAAPQNGTPFVMHFQHVFLRFVARITEDALENHGHVTHQIHRVIMDDHLPRKIDLFFRTRFLFNRRRVNSGWRGTPLEGRFRQLEAPPLPSVAPRS